jgi:hypothetical protein
MTFEILNEMVIDFYTSPFHIESIPEKTSEPIIATELSCYLNTKGVASHIRFTALHDELCE